VRVVGVRVIDDDNAALRRLAAVDHGISPGSHDVALEIFGLEFAAFSFCIVVASSVRVFSTALFFFLRSSLKLAVVNSVSMVPCSQSRKCPVRLIHAIFLVISVWVDRIRVTIAAVLCEHHIFDVLEVAKAKIFARTLRIGGSAVNYSIAETVSREVGSVREIEIVRIVEIDAFVTSVKT